jgi:hypothetical protein
MKTEYASTFPKAIFSASREEFYGQDARHQPLKLTVKKGLTEEEANLPDDLQGHVFIVAPVGSPDSKKLDGEIVEPCADGLTSLFNGDGMIYRLDFHQTQTDPDSDIIQQTGNAWLASRIAKTPDYYLDAAIQKKLDSEPNSIWEKLKFRNWGLARFSIEFGSRNQLNTAFLAMRFPDERDRIVVAWDAGRPYEIDPVTLDLVAPVGWDRDWSPMVEVGPPQPLKGIGSCAHPVFDPYTGEVFTVNLTKTLLELLKLPRLLAYGSEWIGNLLSKVPTKNPTTIDKKNIQQVFFSKPIRPLLHGSKFLTEKLKRPVNEAKINFIIWWIPRLLAKLFVDFLRTIFSLFSSLINWFLHVRGIDRGQDRLYLMRWDGKDNIKKWQVILPSNRKIRQTTHQIGITEKYIILADTAFKITPESFIPGWLKDGMLKWADELRYFFTYPQFANTNFYIVDRSKLDPNSDSVVAVKVGIPREIAHFEVDYANPDDRVIIYGANVCATDPAEFIRRYDESVYATEEQFHNPCAGMGCSPMDVNLFSCYAIDAKTGKLLRDSEASYQFDPELTWAIAICSYRCDRPREQTQLQDIYWSVWGTSEDLLTAEIYDMYDNYEYRKIPAETIKNKIAPEGIPPALVRVRVRRDGDLPVAEIHPDRYQFPKNSFSNSVTFVPRKGSTGSSKGYIVCVVIQSDELVNPANNNNSNWANSSQIWIFDANNLAQGPLYRLSHAQLNLGITIHTTWLSKLYPSPATNYSVREDYKEIVALMKQQQKDPAIAEEIDRLFEEEIYPHFESEVNMMELKEKVCANVKRFYASNPGTKFYIRENETIFPPDYPPTGGKQPGKGSFFLLDSITCDDNKVEAILKVHASIDTSTEMIIVRQRETWTWDKRGKIHLTVDFPDGSGRTFGTPFTAEVLAFNEYNIDLKFVIPLPQCPPNSPPEARSCLINIFQTTLIDGEGIDVFNLLQFIWLDESDRVIAEKMQPKYIAISTNPEKIEVWDDLNKG